MQPSQSLLPPIWVDQPDVFGDMLRHLEAQQALAIDTESNSLFVYREQVCLVQISVPGADYLVDALALHDLSGLGQLLNEPQILKVLHGAEYDLAVLYRDYQFVVTNLFDTMWASRILGWREHGLAALLQSCFGVTLDKKYQRANWGVRPLPPEQLDYARLDSHYLLPLRDIQAEALTATNRWPQASHQFDKLTKIRSARRRVGPDGFWRLSGVRELDDVGRGVLSALYACRDQCAQAENYPPFRFLANQALVALSARRPGTLDELRRMRGVPRRWLGLYGEQLLMAIREGEKHPIAWQSRPRRTHNSSPHVNGPPSPECQARFEALRTWRNTVAEARGVEPDIVLTNQILWAVAYRNPRQRADLSRGDLLAPWQVSEFGEDLLAVLRKTG